MRRYAVDNSNPLEQLSGGSLQHKLFINRSPHIFFFALCFGYADQHQCKISPKCMNNVLLRLLRRILGVPFGNDGLQGLELLLFDEIEFLDEEDEMTTASIDVSSEVLLFDVVRMRKVEMRVDAEETAINILDNSSEVLGEGHVRFLREQGRVLQLLLDPAHQCIDIVGSTERNRLLDLHSIRPFVFVF